MNSLRQLSAKYPTKGIRGKKKKKKRNQKEKWLNRDTVHYYNTNRLLYTQDFSSNEHVATKQIITLKTFIKMSELIHKIKLT